MEGGWTFRSVFRIVGRTLSDLNPKDTKSMKHAKLLAETTFLPTKPNTTP